MLCRTEFPRSALRIQNVGFRFPKAVLQYGFILWMTVLGAASVIAQSPPVFPPTAKPDSPSTDADANQSIPNRVEIEYRLVQPSNPGVATGARKVPLIQLPALLDATKAAPPQPSEVSTQARFSSGSLIGVSSFQFNDQANAAYTLKSFSAAIVNPDRLASAFDVSALAFSKVSHFDKEGSAVYVIPESKSMVVAWESLASTVSSEDDIYHVELAMPWVSNATFDLILDNNYSVRRCNVPIDAIDATELPISIKPTPAEQTTDGNWRCWRMHVGAEEKLSFDIAPAASTDAETSFVFNSEQHDWIVQSAGLEVNASFILDGSSLQKQLSLYIDPKIHIRSLTWDQQPIDFRYYQSEQMIQFDVPASEGMFAGTQHRLFVNGVSQWPTGVEFTPANNESLDAAILPSMHIVGGLAVEGRGSVSLHSDWELVNFDTKSADLTSRSGTTTQGGISRLDFNWRLSRPSLAAKLQRKKRLRKASALVALTNLRDQASATVKVRVDAIPEAWNNLPIIVMPDWQIESTKSETDGVEITFNADNPNEPINLVLGSPAENKAIEFSINLRSKDPFKRSRNANNVQLLELPQSKPILFPELDVDEVYEYLPASGYIVERTPILLHQIVTSSDLNLWLQAAIQTRPQSYLLRNPANPLPAVRFMRQRSNLNLKSMFQISRGVNWLNNTFLVELTPDQSGIQRLDLSIPEESQQLIWRALNKDLRTVQEWQEGVLQPYETPNDSQTTRQSPRNLSLRLERPSAEPLIFECRYRLPSDANSFKVPIVSDYEYSESYVLVDDNDQVLAVSEQGVGPLEKLAEASELESIAPSAVSLLKALATFKIQDDVYQCRPDVTELKIEKQQSENMQTKVTKSIERLFCPSSGPLQYELDLYVAEAIREPLKVSLPPEWTLLSVSRPTTGIPSDNLEASDINYVVSGTKDKSECELAFSTTNGQAQVVRLQWRGPVPPSRYGYSLVHQPTLTTNFLSIEHDSQVLLSDDLSFINPASSTRQRLLTNIHTIAQPWNWSPSLDFYRNTQATSDEARSSSNSADQCFGYESVIPAQTRHHFVRFPDTKRPVDQGEILIVSKPWLQMQRWALGVVAAMLMMILLRVFPVVSPVWVLSLSFISLVMPTVDASIAWQIGMMAGLILQGVLAVMAASEAAKTKLSSANNSRVQLQQSLSKIERRSGVRTASLLLLIALWFLVGSTKVIFAQETLEIGDRPAETSADNALQKVLIPIDSQSFRLAPFVILEEGREMDAKPSANDSSLASTLLSADHVLTCRPNQSVLATHSANVVCTYKFHITEGQTPIAFPWDITKAIFDQFSVDGKVQSLGQNLRFAESKLLWIPNRQGDVVVQLKVQLRARNANGLQSAQFSVLPCAAAQVQLDTDLLEVRVKTDLQPAIVASEEKQIPIGKASSLEMTWDPVFTSYTKFERMQYDSDTQIILSNSTPVAITRMRIGGVVDQQITLDWSNAWRPIGKVFREARRTERVMEPASVGRERCAVQSLKRPTANSSVLDLEVYWRPVGDRLDSIGLPDPRIVEATPNIRTLRYTKDENALWALTGVETWSPVTNAPDGLGTYAGATNGMAVLRIPESSGLASIRSNRSIPELPDARVQVAYRIGSSRIDTRWKGIVVQPLHNSLVNTWLVDSRLKIESIRWNSEETLFTVDRWSDQYHLVKALGDAERRVVSSIEIEASSDCSQSFEDKLPLINWCNLRIVQSQFTVARQVGLPLTLENLPSSAVRLGTLRSNPSMKSVLPFEEVLTEAEEAVPFQISYPSTLDASVKEKIAAEISMRELFQVTTKSTNAAPVLNATASIRLDARSSRFEFLTSLENNMEESGLLISIPTQDVSRLQSDQAITKLGSISDVSYLYLRSKRSSEGSASQQQLRFWIEQERKGQELNFSVPAIEFLSAPQIECTLDRSDLAKNDSIEWEIRGWQKPQREAVDDKQDPNDEAGSSDLLFAKGGIPSIRLSNTAMRRTEISSPYSAWVIQRSENELMMEGVLCVLSDSSGSISLEVPSYIQSIAIHQLTQSVVSDFSNADIGLQESRRIALNIAASKVPQLVTIRALIKTSNHESLPRLIARDFALIVADGRKILTQDVYVGFEPKTTSVDPGDLKIQLTTSEVLHRLAKTSLELLADSKADLERLSNSQRPQVKLAWSSFIGGALLLIPSSTNAIDTELISKYQGLFSANERFIGSKRTSLAPFFDRLSTASVSWTQDVGSGLQLQKAEKASMRWSLADSLRWIGLLVPMMLYSLINMSTRLGEQLRAMLDHYPWRLFCLIGLGVALIPYSVWLALCLGTIAGTLCLISYFRDSMESN